MHFELVEKPCPVKRVIHSVRRFSSKHEFPPTTAISRESASRRRGFDEVSRMSTTESGIFPCRFRPGVDEITFNTQKTIFFETGGVFVGTAVQVDVPQGTKRERNTRRRTM